MKISYTFPEFFFIKGAGYCLVGLRINCLQADINDMLYYGTEEIPYGSVYSLGYSIVYSFRKNNPSIDDQELIDLSPVRILNDSKFSQY